MNEETIIQVAKVLEHWNPPGEAANSIDQLDGYCTEAIDIISTTKIKYGRKHVESVIEDVLTQAFAIELTEPPREYRRLISLSQAALANSCSC